MDNKKIFNFFPQTVFKYKVNDFKEYNKKLSEYIYNLQKNDKNGIQRSNRGGWHSDSFKLKDVNSIQHEFALETSKYVFDTIKTYGWILEPKKVICSEMWAIINKKNDFNIMHTHPNCNLSAAYYVKAPKNCGSFFIENPNIARRYFRPEIANRNELNGEVAGIEINDDFVPEVFYSKEREEQERARAATSATALALRDGGDDIVNEDEFEEEPEEQEIRRGCVMYLNDDMLRYLRDKKDYTVYTRHRQVQERRTRKRTEAKGHERG